LKLKREYAWIAFFAVAKLLIHLLTGTNYELHRDEYLYIAEGDRLDFGFASTPPLTALVARAAHLLLGDSALAYRFFPALAGAVTVILVGLLVLEFGGKTLAMFTACLAYMVSVSYLRMNSMLQPVSFDAFFWVLSALIAVRMLRQDDSRYWRILGIVWGFAFLNKYAIVFFIAAFLIALALTPQRRLMASRHFWTGAAIGLVIAFPNLVWQFRHNWPVVHHMAELQRTQLVNVTLMNFIVDQLLMNVHALGLWMVGLIVLLFFRGERIRRPLALTFVVCLVILMLARGKSYYTLGLYPPLFAAGAAMLEKYLTGTKKIIIYFFIACMSLSIPIAPYGLPLLKHDAMARFGRAAMKYTGPAPLRWETGQIHDLPQDYADMTGWRELADLVTAAYNSLPEAERKSCSIYTGNYGEAAAIRYYGRSIGLPEPVCYNDQFLLWTPDSLKAKNLIHVDDDTSDVRLFFRSVTLIGTVTNRYAREFGLPVLLCEGPSEELQRHYSEERNDRLRIYRRGN
jgi:hypothetical protein